MQLATVVDSMVKEHSELHERLGEWETMLGRLTGGTFFQSRAALEQLWRLVPYFEEELPRHFSREESDLYPPLKEEHPGATPVLKRFSVEHTELLRLWKNYRAELLYSDAIGETHRLRELGSELIAGLRQHMQDEELELVGLARQK
ncbi:MAG TPA: hemerythrin domain-containing protein [Candidatus Acidoferrales bacterium]|nr:hemerythrin domain-containing protein [Candidatus Acidoferrales bacterium]